MSKFKIEIEVDSCKNCPLLITTDSLFMCKDSGFGVSDTGISLGSASIPGFIPPLCPHGKNETIEYIARQLGADYVVISEIIKKKSYELRDLLNFI